MSHFRNKRGFKNLAILLIFFLLSTMVLNFKPDFSKAEVSNPKITDIMMVTDKVDIIHAFGSNLDSLGSETVSGAVYSAVYDEVYGEVFSDLTFEFLSQDITILPDYNEIGFNMGAGNSLSAGRYKLFTYDNGQAIPIANDGIFEVLRELMISQDTILPGDTITIEEGANVLWSQGDAITVELYSVQQGLVDTIQTGPGLGVTDNTLEYTLPGDLASGDYNMDIRDGLDNLLAVAFMQVQSDDMPLAETPEVVVSPSAITFDSEVTVYESVYAAEYPVYNWDFGDDTLNIQVYNNEGVFGNMMHAPLQDVTDDSLKITMNPTGEGMGAGEYHLKVFKDGVDDAIGIGYFSIVEGGQEGQPWDNFDIPFRLVSEDAQINISFYNLETAVSNLKLDLYSPGDPEDVLIANLHDAEVDSTDGSWTTVQFSYSGTGANSLDDPQANGQNVYLKIIYGENDEDKAITPPDVTVDNTGIQTDDSDKSMHTWLSGIKDTGDYAGKYMVEVNFNDVVDISSIQNNQDETNSYISLLNPNETISYPVAIEGLHGGWGGDYPDYFETVIVYFDSVDSGSIINIGGIDDVMGHPMNGEYSQDFRIDTYVQGQILDADGNPIPNARAEMIEIDSILSASLDDGPMYEFRDVFTSDIDPYQFDNWIEPGTWVVFSVEVPEPEWEGDGPPPMTRYSVDQIVEIPSMLDTEYDHQNPYEFNIQLQNANVQGSSVREEDQAYEEKIMFIDKQYTEGDWAAFEDQYIIYEVFGKTAKTAPNGEFQLYLRPGVTYKVLGKRSGHAITPPLEDYEFTVPEGASGETPYTLLFNIEFPPMNVNGTVVDYNGDPVPYAMVAFEDIQALQDDMGDTMPKYMGFTDEMGQYMLAMPEGSYFAAAVNIEWGSGSDGGFYFLDGTFDIDSGGNVINIAGTSLSDQDGLKVAMPQPNVTVKLAAGGDILTQGGGMGFSALLDGEMGEFDLFTGSETGIFNFYLLPGVYTIENVHGPDFWLDNLNYEFTVDGSTNLTGDNALIIDVFGQSNVVVEVRENGELYAGEGDQYNVGIPVDGKNNFYHDWRNTNGSGKAYFNLEPGTYKIPGYDVNGQWYDVREEFTVDDTHSKDNPLTITVNIQSPNVNGIVKDENGDPIPYAWVNVKRLRNEGELFDEYFGFNTNNMGEFSTSLGAGTYIVEGVGTENSWQEMNFKFFVVDVGGQLVVKTDLEGDPVETLTIQKEPNNVQGYVFKSGTSIENGVPYQGNGNGSGWIDVWLVLVEQGVSEEDYNWSPWMYEKWVEVNDDGSFGTLLDTSKSYYVKAIMNAGMWIDLDSGDEFIEITPPDTDLLIIPPAPNFYGTVLQFDGNPVGMKGWLNIEKADFTEWIGVDIAEDGTFGRNLKAGEEYIVREATFVNQNTWDWENAITLSFNTRFTVGAETENITLKPNVQGTINLAGLVSQDEEHVGIIIRPKLVEKQEGEEGYDLYVDMRDNPWKYEKWAKLSLDVNSMGTFTTYLKDGQYVLAGIPTMNGWVEIRQQFTLDGTTSGIVSYENDRYTLSLDFQPNVTGTVEDENGNPVQNAWINIEKDVEMSPDEPHTWNPDNHFGTNTNAEGEFSLKLDLGDYILRDYHTPGEWDPNTNRWNPGKHVQVDYRFTVEDGIDEVIEIRPNVSGVVKKVFREGDNADDFVGTPEVNNPAEVRDAWVMIKPVDPQTGEPDWNNWQDTIWTHTGWDSGEFMLMLSEGDYMVVEAGGRGFWMRTEIPFSVDANGDLAADASYIDNGKLLVKQQEPNFRGHAYTDIAGENALNRGWIAVKPAAAKEHQWDQARWLETKSDGSFEGRLSEGEWKVVEINAPGIWKRVSIPITVDAQGVATSTVADKVEGLFVIKPQAPNLTGIVKDPEGNTYEGNAWLHIKLADAAEHDWEGSFGLEYRYDEQSQAYKFEGFVGQGQYKVVNVGAHDFWYDANIRFDINESNELVEVTEGSVVTGELVVSQPEPNVSGVLYGRVDGQDESLRNGWLGIARFDANGNQLTLEGEEINEENEPPKLHPDELYWNYTRWSGTNENGEFSFNLPVGIFKVIGANGQASDGQWKWFEPDTEFTVVDGQPTTVTVTEPSPNVTITVVNAPTSHNEAWLDVQVTEEINGQTEKWFVPIHLEEKTETGYVFTSWLKEGDYTITSFGTPDSFMEIEQEFTVGSTAVNITVDFNAQTRKTVSATLQNVTDVTGVKILPVVGGNLDTSVNKKMVYTSDSGEFSFRLEPGTTWAVTDITTVDAYYEISSADAVANYSYTVTDSDSQTAGVWSIDVDTLEEP